MSHGVHAVQHEVEHQIEHEEHGHGGGHGKGKGLADNMNKKIALLISVIALFLAFSETLGKSAQTEGIGANVEAANLWAFFQAKTIRRTLVETASREMTVSLKGTTDAAVKPEMEKQIANWAAEGARYRSEPSTQEGSTELARARQGRREKARHPSGALPQLRIRIGRLSDRHRAGFRGRHHRHDRAGLWRHRARPHRPHVHRHGAVCATCSA